MTESASLRNPSLAELLQRLEHRLVLDGCRDQVHTAGAAAGVRQAEERQVVTLGGAAGENDLLRVGLNDRGHGVTGALNGFLGAQTPNPWVRLPEFPYSSRI